MQRGRKSFEARSISNMLALSSPTSLLDRPKAPRELTKEQKAEWDRIVGRMPSDWFGPETWPMLASLCRHIVYARAFAGELDELMETFKDMCLRLHKEHPELAPKEIRCLAGMQLEQRGELVKMHTDQTRMIAMLSTKLRLTLQSRIQAVTAGRKIHDRNQEPAKMPWEKFD